MNSEEVSRARVAALSAYRAGQPEARAIAYHWAPAPSVASQLAFTGIAILIVIATIEWLWPLVIYEPLLKPYPWCVFLFFVFAARRWSGQLSSWLIVLAGVVFAADYMPGGIESMIYRALLLVMIAGAGKPDCRPLNKCTIDEYDDGCQKVASIEC